MILMHTTVALHMILIHTTVALHMILIVSAHLRTMKHVTKNSGYSVCTVYIHIHVYADYDIDITPTPTTCTYIGVIFGFFLLNIFLDCLWKRDQLMLKVKVLLVTAEELFTVFIGGFVEATPGIATNMYSLLLQWTTGLNAAAPQMKVSHFTRTSVVLSLGSGTIFACLHCIEIRLGCSIILLLSLSIH